MTLPDGGVLDLAVPEGVTDGQTLRLKGKGTPGGPGTEPGDALVEIKYASIRTSSAKATTFFSSCRSPIDEAVLGGRVEVPTPTGRVQLNIPKGTSSGKRSASKARAFAAKTAYTAISVVTIKIVLPQDIDDSLSYFFSEWRQKHGYDPGRK